MKRKKYRTSGIEYGRGTSINVRLSRELNQKFGEYANAQGNSRSEIVREMIKKLCSLKAA